MIWNPYDWLNKFYSLYMAAFVNIISRHGLTIVTRHTNQPNKNKLALYKPLIHICSHLKQFHHMIIKVSVVCVGVILISICLKKSWLELRTDKLTWIIYIKQFYH